MGYYYDEHDERNARAARQRRQDGKTMTAT